MCKKDTYLFLPPTGVGERTAAEKAPVIVEATFNEACDLAHGVYRGWKVFVQSAIGVPEPKFRQASEQEEVLSRVPGMGMGHTVVVYDADDLHVK